MAGGINLYAYVGGNPLSLTDPFGLCRRGWKQVAGQAEGVCEPDNRVDPDKCAIGGCGTSGLPPPQPQKQKTECEIKCGVGLSDLKKNTGAFFACEAFGEPWGWAAKTTLVSLAISEAVATVCQAYYERKCIQKCEDEKEKSCNGGNL